MSQRTENQVAEMKKQTIGVEVEMNSITREKAARLAATFFGTGRYENTACRNGYCTWSAWDESGREWKFQKDVSIAGPDSEKCEMVTPILTYVDMETLQELVRRLRKAGAKSDATRGCGVHIHIGAKGHTPQTLRNLANIMASHEDLLASALNLDRGRISRYCRTVDPRFLERLNNRKPTTMAALADIWYGSQNADYGRSQHYNDSRYHILEHTADDALLKSYITAAVSYAESYQHIPEGFYKENPMPATTEQAVIMLSSHFYESRDGSTGGFFADNTGAAQQVWNTVNLLLRLDRRWQV